MSRSGDFVEVAFMSSFPRVRPQQHNIGGTGEDAKGTALDLGRWEILKGPFSAVSFGGPERTRNKAARLLEVRHDDIQSRISDRQPRQAIHQSQACHSADPPRPGKPAILRS